MSGNSDAKWGLYDPVANPYAPGAGTAPPYLVGRDEVLADTDIALRRLLAHRPGQHRMITGLRGVGKTVLLGTLAAVAERLGFRVGHVAGQRRHRRPVRSHARP